MSEAITVVIDAAGAMRFIWTDELAELAGEGEARIERASHVEPVGCQWVADLSPVNGPTLGPFALRGEALGAEIDWLERNYLALKS